MKNLKDLIKENFITKDNTQDNVSTVNEAKVNEKLFWKWIKELGEVEMMDEINDAESGEPLYKKAYELGTTVEQFEEFVEIFYELSNKFNDLMYDEDLGFGSDDRNEYASWSAPFHGEQAFNKALKAKKVYSVCDQYQGEEVGYAMDSESYKEYLQDNDLTDELKGFK